LIPDDRLFQDVIISASDEDISFFSNDIKENELFAYQNLHTQIHLWRCNIEIDPRDKILLVSLLKNKLFSEIKKRK
jgi:hypothetical protein